MNANHATTQRSRVKRIETSKIGDIRLFTSAPLLIEHLKRVVNIATHQKATKAAIKLIAEEARAAIRAAEGGEA